MAQLSRTDMQAVIARVLADPTTLAGDALVRASHPINDCAGTDAHRPWATLIQAMPDVTRHETMFLAGPNLPDARETGPRPAFCVATMGVYLGQMSGEIGGLPGGGRTVQLRFCEVYGFQGDQITQAWLLWDFPDLMRQLQVWPLPPSLGREASWLAPSTAMHDLGTEQDDTGAMDLVLKMHAALLSFDGKSLDSMPHADYWSDDFLWHGPAGIGTTRGLTEFRAHHQIPFLKAFPDRHGTGHFIRISDGPFAVTGGWPSVRGTHAGSWLGMGPTGAQIDMRVMDFYATENGKITQNWVPIDICHIALQMGVDLFERARHLAGHPQITL